MLYYFHSANYLSSVRAHSFPMGEDVKGEILGRSSWNMNVYKTNLATYKMQMVAEVL